MRTSSGNFEHVIKSVEYQTIGWEVYSQEGNSPELLLKSQITFKLRINFE